MTAPPKSLRIALTSAALLALVVLCPSANAIAMEEAHREHHDMTPPAAAGAREEEHLHVHPVADESTEKEVGLDERLGASIPLDIAFADEQGRSVTLRDLIDGPTIIAPVYYHCPNVCNFLQGGLAQTLPGVQRKPVEDYRVLSISFDETETPSVASKARQTYLTAMGQPFPAEGWRFLTGDLPAIKELTDAAGYRFMRQGDDFLHPVAVFVVTGEGKIVRYLYGTSFLPMDLTLALVEAAEGRVGTPIRKMLEFCFSYDPQNNRYVFNLLRVSATVILLTAGSFLAFLLLTGRKAKDRTKP